jgi:cell wall-associated NlpC family hydrolase
LRLRTEGVLGLLCLVPASLPGQTDLDLYYGRWYHGNDAASYEVRTDAPLGGIFSHGFALQVLVHDRLGRHRAFYGAGWELHGWRRRRDLGAYSIAGVALGLSTDTAEQQLAALWSLGVGVEWRPVSWFALGGEGRYRIEDRGPRGFWSPGDGSRRGVSLAVGTSIHWRSGGPRSEARDAAPPRPLPAPRSPPSVPLITAGGAAGDVVHAALEALGRPYQWGGTAANGFDCSGLIQYAYALHSIRVPRTSRAQATAGTEVAPVVEALKPGDILLFAARPGGGVTHVGMYVGELKFIHSSNTGVRLSRLELHDPDGSWWLTRWVGARRVIP